MRRSAGLLRYTLNAIICILMKDRFYNRTSGNVKMEKKIGAKECQQPPETGRGREQILPESF